MRDAQRIIGVDPGLSTTGVGIIECDTNKQMKMLFTTVISPDKKLAIQKRLLVIQDGIRDLIATYQPDILAVEEMFHHKNVRSALLLGQARAAVLLAAAAAEIEVMELSPRTVKQSVTGTGGAAKQQVAAMVTTLLKLPEPPRSLDASDALAIALAALNRSQLPRAIRT